MSIGAREVSLTVTVKQTTVDGTTTTIEKDTRQFPLNGSCERVALGPKPREGHFIIPSLSKSISLFPDLLDTARKETVQLTIPAGSSGWLDEYNDQTPTTIEATAENRRVDVKFFGAKGELILADGTTTVTWEFAYMDYGY